MSVLNIAKLLGALLGVSCLLAGVSPGQTLSPRKALGRYQQFVWQDQHGLPQNGVNAITRTRDDYLWLGTFEGAARFDGVRFTVFDGNNTPEFKNHQILTLLEDRAGNLWFGTNGGGLVRRTGESFKLYTTRDGLSSNYVRSLAEDTEGNLWIGTESSGLNRLRDEHFETYTTKDGLPGDYVRALVADRDGGLWIGAERGLARFKDGRFTAYPSRDEMPVNDVNALCLDHAGALWVGTLSGGLLRFENGRFTDSGWQLKRGRVVALYEDKEFNLWVGAEGGLAVFRDGVFSNYTVADGLPGETVLSLYEDAEGDMWVGTEDGGACQLRASRFLVYTKQDGLPHDFTRAVFEDAGGQLWVGTSGGVARFKDGSVTAYTTNDGLPENGGTSITEDRAGRLWVSTRGKLSRFQAGRFIAQPIENGQAFNNPVTILLGDRAGNLWIGTRGSGLNLYRDGRFTLYTTRDGLTSNEITALYEDRQGNIWVGTLNGGISRFKDGRFTTWTSADGLPGQRVNAFYEDRRGGLWIGTEGGGLCRFRDGRFSILTVKDGLYDNLAFQILSDTEDDSGDLWLSCNKGIYRASLQELNDFAEGKIKAVSSYSYGVADGMLSRECNGASPGGWKTRDGRLWFPTVRGVVAINPQQRDTRPPLVNIEGALVDRAPRSVSTSLQLEPGQENVEIRYTALSWRRPQQVRFRYRLEGLDHQWVEAGGRRTAYYSYLPPGTYTFKVIADNGEGVWNLEGQSLSIIVLPPFYRTWWFLALLFLTMAALALSMFRLRLQQLERKHRLEMTFSRRLIDSQEQERKRIAAELHDSLGQLLVIIKNRARMGLKNGENSPATIEHLDEISGVSSQAINEVKEISFDLRPYLLDKLGLTKTLKSMLTKVFASSETILETEINDVDKAFPKDGEILFYRIVQESASNIVKHAHASRAAVTIKRAGKHLTLQITDDGAGFDTAAQASSATRSFGLIGIAERARLLGGTHSIVSETGKGTTVTVEIELQHERD